MMTGCVVVAGGSGTIGTAVVNSLATSGVPVVASSRRPRPSAENVRWFSGDLLVPAMVREFSTFAIQGGRSVKGLVVCLPGGMVRGGARGHAPMWWSQIHIDIVEAFTPLMANGGGEIVMFSSTAATRPFATGRSRFYAADKGCIDAYVRCASAEFAPQVRINAIAPGFVQGDSSAGGLHSRTNPMRIPMRRFAEPMEVARLVRSLLFDNCYMTGQILILDGGMSAMLFDGIDD